MTAKDELQALIDRHHAHMRKLRRDLAIRIPVAILLGVSVGLLLRLFLV